METVQAIESSKEFDKEAEGDSTQQQVIELHFEEKEVEERDEVESGKKHMPRACKWLS